MGNEQDKLINNLIITHLQYLVQSWKKKTMDMTYPVFGTIPAFADLQKEIDIYLNLFSNYNLDHGKSVQWVEREIEKNLPMLYEHWYYGD